MAGKRSKNPRLTQRDLSRWRLVEDFKSRLVEAVEQRGALHPTWLDAGRLLQYGDYLSLFLFGLLNPVVRTMRGLCCASRLKRVQKQICSRAVSLGSFSEAQGVLEPELLEEVFTRLSQEVCSRAPERPSASQRLWLIQDGSLFEALPRMYWALWRRQGKAQAQVRLHLSLEMDSASPARARITPGKGCERAAWRELMQPGDAYVGDRYYGEDYKLFQEMEESGVAFVVRLRDQAVITVLEELPLSAADRQANVIGHAWVQLGGKGYRQDQRLRLVRVQIEGEVLLLVTNLSPEELPAGEVALMYKERWQIELFFRWVKCILGCRHWLAESPQGVAIQIYLALIAALLLLLYTGQQPNRRMMELIQFYLLGVATLQELWAGLQRLRAQAARRKKS